MPMRPEEREAQLLNAATLIMLKLKITGWIAKQYTHEVWARSARICYSEVFKY